MPQQLKYFKNKLNSMIDEFKKTTDKNSDLEHIKSINEILTEIQQSKDEIRRQRLKILFPKQSTEEMKPIGLAEESNALLFLNSAQTSHSIIEKLINSLELNKIDFCSVIFEKILPQAEDEAEVKSFEFKNPEKYLLLSTVKSLYQHFSEQQGLDKIDCELEQLNKLEKDFSFSKFRIQRGMALSNMKFLSQR